MIFRKYPIFSLHKDCLNVHVKASDSLEVGTIKNDLAF